MSFSRFLIASLLALTPAWADIHHYISPSGNTAAPGDTPAIQTALLSCQGATQPCTVELAPGHFYIEQLAARDYRGVFKGAGIHQTILHAIPGMKVSPDWTTYYWSRLPSPTYKTPNLIFFTGGQVTMSDMTVRIDDPYPMVEYDVTGDGWMERSVFNTISFHPDPDLPNAVYSSRFLRLGVHGALGSIFSGAYQVNTANLITIGAMFGYAPLKGGVHLVQSCEFSNAVTGVYPLQTDRSLVLIGGNASKSNRFFSIYDAIDIFENSGSQVEVSYNDIEATWFGVAVDQGVFGFPQAEPVTAYIAHNRIAMLASPSPREGIYVNDRQLSGGGTKSLRATVAQNTVELAPGAVGGIDAWNSHGTLISNNRVLGAAQWGIAAMGADSAQFVGNNLHGLIPAKAHFFLSGEGTYQSPDGYGGYITVPYKSSRNCRVIGGGNHEMVLDEGINNSVSGARRK